ncbi:ATP-binding protein [Limosilactobacillus reuteri]|uniref:ATP-binding protein n=1 Tax=Limosilactobacillus reuteri TaxID=1598 RepID=UPI0012E11B24|nr:ATP-binding protein [Limosilactobacillus reuteri]
MDSINKLLTTAEDEYHDFKAQWYSKNDRAELIKDIFSFVNTSHHKDCYLIIGVNDNHEVVGVENDSNRLNTQKITDFLHSLPIANAHTPKIKVTPITVENHTVDVIVIKDTLDVPVYLDEDKRPKYANRPIHAGQIFARENDTNTPIDESASDYLVQRLWKKRFGLDLTIQQQYVSKLKDVNNWEYFEADKIGFLYNVDPDYCMFLEEDDENRYRVESYALGQFRARMDWQKLVLKYRNRTISEFLVVFLDGARFMTLTPNLGSINPLSDNLLTFQYFIADTLEYTVERLFLSMKQGPTAPDGLQKFNLFQRVVVFENKNQKDQVLDELSGKQDYIEEQCNPTQEEIDRCRSLLKMDFNSHDTEMTESNIEHMCKEANVSQFIISYLKTM